MEENVKSRFFRLIDHAISINRLPVIQNLYKIRDFITDDLEIIYSDDIELLELVVRTLVFIDMEMKVLDDKIVVLNCPEEKQPFVLWFVKFFGYLESSDPYYRQNQYVLYYPTADHYFIFESEWCPGDLDIEKMMFGYGELDVEFQSRIEGLPA